MFRIFFPFLHLFLDVVTPFFVNRRTDWPYSNEREIKIQSNGGNPGNRKKVVQSVGFLVCFLGCCLVTSLQKTGGVGMTGERSFFNVGSKLGRSEKRSVHAHVCYNPEMLLQQRWYGSETSVWNKRWSGVKNLLHQWTRRVWPQPWVVIQRNDL